MRVKMGDILICPYDDCHFSGAADHGFKRVKGQVSIFVCPKCKRKFSAFVDEEGVTRYSIPKQITRKHQSTDKETRG